MNPRHCLDVYQIYREYLFSAYRAELAESKWSKFKTAVLRYLLPELGFQRADYTRKMTNSEVTLAEQFLESVWPRTLRRFLTLTEQGLQQQEASQSSFNTFRSAMSQFVEWGAQEIWWPNNRGVAGIAADQLCPPRAPQGQAIELPKLMDRGALTSYGFKLHHLSPVLQADIRQLEQFLTDPDFPLRVIDPIGTLTYDNYVKNVLLLLGWFHRHHQPAITFEDLSLDLIFPVLPEADLEAMSDKQRTRFWRRQKQHMQQWLSEYRQFLRTHQSSDNPRTWLGKLSAVLAVGHYQCREQVEYKTDYREIPLLKYVRDELNKVQADIRRWNSNNSYASDQTLKWPEFVPDEETALGVLRRDVVEHLRRKCRPLTGVRGRPRSAYQLGLDHQRFLMWVHLCLIAARRQKTLRTTRIATSCPVQRPKSVPIEGLYHPLPPDSYLTKRPDGSVKENWLCRVYSYGGHAYPEGAWLHIVRDYKTWTTHGDQVLVLPNWQFEDGQRLYDLLERHLNGYWLVGNFRSSRRYHWSAPADWADTQGRWLTHGRNSLNPQDFCLINSTREYWTWGYLYLRPTQGVPMEEGDFTNAFARGANNAIGKWTTPHLMRNIWASWGFTVLKTDRELRSLAFAMGMTVETMRKRYERCTPEAKIEPIESAIAEHFASDEADEAGVVTLQQAVHQVKTLSAEDRKQLIVEMVSWD